MDERKAHGLYVVNHWGKTGKNRISRLRCPLPDGVLSELGILKSVVYETRKGGDDGPTEYEHDFEKPYPVLAVNEAGLLLICGGKYKVTVRGIVG
jgi:hypothetical protein